MAQKMYEQYSDLFQGLGCLPGEHTWHSACFPQREIKEELDRMKKIEVVVKQKEPTEWVNSMVAVVTPNKLRICIDPRDLKTQVNGVKNLR